MYEQHAITGSNDCDVTSGNEVELTSQMPVFIVLVKICFKVFLKNIQFKVFCFYASIFYSPVN